MHPGQILTELLTELGRHLTPAEIAGFNALDEDGRPRIDPSRGMKTAAQWAATGVWCATNPQFDGLGGDDHKDCGREDCDREDCDVITVHAGETGWAGVPSWATDDAPAARL